MTMPTMEREFRSNESIASEFRRHFLDDEISPGIEKELELLAEFLPQLTLEAINELADVMLQDEDRVLLVIGPSAPSTYAEREALRAELATSHRGRSL